ncbi:MAG: tRNA pseudouridine(55) synthase TruB [Alphaproteobacteria bacterium]|nr:tRNA pseudouridine(55) synthase TruB [Alphaproteobacteria bacterium]
MSKINGWLCVYKPKNITSAQFLSRISKYFPGTKLGHAGTLDPLAEGILPVGLGEATKLMDLLINSTKEYEFSVKFGARTPSGDLGSEIIEHTDNKVEKESLVATIAKFQGEVSQIPSKFSAIKIKGKRAYAMARIGMEFEIKPRVITIYSLTLKDFDYDNQVATLVCECSKGTYIRTLAEDIAFSLQNLGYVLELRRLRAQKFDLSNSIDLDLEDKENSLKLLQAKLLPVDFVLDDILVINVNEDIAYRIRCGQKILFPSKVDGFYAIFSETILLAIGYITQEVFKVQRVFNL